MTTACYSMVRGSAARFTLLDSRGTPVQGDSSVITTKGISQIKLDEVTDTVGTTLVRTDYDKPRLRLEGKTNVIGYTADIRLVGVDPDLLWLLTGQPRVLNAAGDVVGNDARLRLPIANFAMEVWSKLAAPVDGYTYGYTLFPRVRGGRVTGFLFSNGAVSFSISGSRTSRNSRWGYGPHDLVWDSQGGFWDIGGWDTGAWDSQGISTCEPIPDVNVGLGFGESAFGEVDFGDGETVIEPRTEFKRLGSPVSRNLHWRNFLVRNVPPTMCGAQPLYDSINGGSAGSTTSDVLDGQFVTTSSDVVDGGGA